MSRLNELPQAVRDALEYADTVSGMECPECHGGDTNERSFSIAREGMQVSYRCWRASCGYHGKSVVAGEAAKQSEFTPRKCKLPMQPVSEADSRILRNKYGLELMTLNVSGVKSVYESYAAIYMPVRSPYGEDRGGTTRRMGEYGAKSMTYKTKDGVFQAWYTREEGPVIIVEDQLSAMKLWQMGYSAVALLGTAITHEKLAEIKDVSRRLRCDYALLALDNDAYSTALKYAKRYASTLTLIPFLLQKDIKDMSTKEILELLEGVKEVA